MTHRLLQNAMTRVHQNNGQIGCGSPRHHIAGVLYMPWRIGNYELTLGSGKITIGHIYGNALLTLRSQSVSQQGKIDFLIAPLF